LDIKPSVRPKDDRKEYDRQKYMLNKVKRKAQAKKYQEEHKDDYAARHRKPTYGLVEGEYQKMKLAQDGKCAICKDSCTLMVDHSHNTNKIRGLLCRFCNCAVGFIRDNPEVALNMAEYLNAD